MLELLPGALTAAVNARRWLEERLTNLPSVALQHCAPLPDGGAYMRLDLINRWPEPMSVGEVQPWAPSDAVIRDLVPMLPTPPGATGRLSFTLRLGVQPAEGGTVVVRLVLVRHRAGLITHRLAHPFRVPHWDGPRHGRLWRLTGGLLGR